MVKKLKAIEYFASFFIICVFCVAVGKYYYSQIRSFDLSDIKYGNTTQNEKTITTHDLLLSRDANNDSWRLYDNDHEEESRQFVVAEDKQGNLSIQKKQLDDNNSFSLVARVAGVHTYFSQQDGPIETEIPFDNKKISFLSFEQEDVIPIMGYHFILSDDQEIAHDLLEINQSDFRKQVKFMTEDLGCRWFTFAQIMNGYVLKNRKVPQKACVMNFDDGRRNNFTQALPVLEEFGVKATFYVITDRIGSSDEYMTWNQIDKLHQRGHEIGSHTYDSGSLVDTLEKGGDSAREKVQFQLEESLATLRKRGYKTTTFAYPRGEWNSTIVREVKKAGYIAARDIRKKDTWRDKRTSTIGSTGDFIWHMHYIKPEGMSNEQLQRTFAYDGWWQFEENFDASQEEPGESSIKIISSARPTDRSHAVVSLSVGQKISNTFLVSQSGQYNIEFFGALSRIRNKGGMDIENTVKMYVDKKELNIHNVTKMDCRDSGIWRYCTYGAKVNLTEGSHILTMKALSEQILLDKFQAFRVLPVEKEYAIKIVDVVTNPMAKK